MKFIKKIFYRYIFREINNFNLKILNSTKWEEVDYGHEARIPDTWGKKCGELKILNEYFGCINLSHQSAAQVHNLQEEYFNRLHSKD